MRRFELAYKEVENKMLFDSAQMPFVTLKRPFYFSLFIIIHISTKEKKGKKRTEDSKRPIGALFFAFLS